MDDEVAERALALVRVVVTINLVVLLPERLSDAALVNAVAALLDEGAATYWELEHQRLLYGATRGELTEVVANLDGTAAVAYQVACGSTV